MLGGDAFQFVILSMCLSRSLAAEDLFLRGQLSLYTERGAKPRWIDSAPPDQPSSRSALDESLQGHDKAVQVFPRDHMSDLVHLAHFDGRVELANLDDVFVEDHAALAGDH